MAGIHPRRRRRKRKKALLASLDQSVVSAPPAKAAIPLDTARIVTRFKQLKAGGQLG